MSVHTTKERIIQTCYELVKESCFKSVTVQQIVDRCGISRKTFYNYFKDKYDVFESSTDYVIHDIGNRIGSDYNWRAGMKYTLDYINEFKNINRKLSPYINDHLCDTLYNTYITIMRLQNITLTECHHSQIRFYSIGCTETFHKWVMSGCKETKEKTLEYLIKCLPSEIRDIMVLNGFY